MNTDQLISPNRQQLLSYISQVWSGKPADANFERQSISDDLGLDTLDLVEILLALSKNLKIGPDRVADKLRASNIKIPGAEDYADDKGGWASLANLFTRISMLSEQFPEEQRDALLIAGIVGPGNEVRPFDSRLTVGFVLKYCRAILA